MITHQLDANVVADVGRGSQPNVTRRFAAIDPSTIAVSAIVLGELRVGIEKTGSIQDEARLRFFLASVTVLEITEPISIEYARLRANLERIGQKMGGNDLWIAATALVHGATLVTADAAFARVPGLRVKDWQAG